MKIEENNTTKCRHYGQIEGTQREDNIKIIVIGYAYYVTENKEESILTSYSK